MGALLFHHENDWHSGREVLMHDNARPGGDREYRSDLSLPWVDDLLDPGGQQTRPDDNIGAVRPRPHSVVEQSTVFHRVNVIKTGS